MEAYEELAGVYDLFMDGVDYDAWGKFLISRLREEGITDGLVLDLGCGTGTMTEILSQAGYDMIGVDRSEEMLSKAMEKRYQSGHDILYLQQDMEEFELYGTVRAVVSVCDCLNYLTEEEDLLQVFRLVNNYLDPRGLFIFDMNTEYKFREMLGNSTFADSRDEGSFIWENTYEEEEKLNFYDLTLFLPAGKGLYRKYEETHCQRAYSSDRVKELLKKAGLVPLGVYDGYSLREGNEKSERLVFMARENGKKAGNKETGR